MVQRYDYTTDPWTPAPTLQPAVMPPVWEQTPDTHARTDATATPKPTPVPRIGAEVPAGAGWWVRVDKVERWRPSWYHERGWRLISAHITVGMPADEYQCAWSDMFIVTAPSGREYTGWQDSGREPRLFECGDYHRRTQGKGWVTFEVRDKDARA